MLTFTNKEKIDIKKSNEQLKIFLDKLIKTSIKVIENIHDPMIETNFHQMCYSFLKKQINHAISVKKLDDNYDTSIIARSMLECMFTLLWTTHESDEERTILWNDYRHVYNFKKLLQDNPINMNDLSSEERKIRKKFEEYIKKYHPKKFDSIDHATLKNNKFNFSWHKTSIYEMANDVEGEDLYLQHYFEFSEWTHSTISGACKVNCVTA